MRIMPAYVLTRLSVAVVAMCAAIVPAAAHMMDDIVVEGCTDVDLHPDPVAVIAPCTKLIESGTLEGDRLAAALRHRGDAYFRTKQYDKALLAYNRALEHQWLYPRALWNRHNLYSILGQPKEAFRDLASAYINFPEHPLILEAMGIKFARLGFKKTAITFYTMALEADPSMLRVKLNRVRSYIVLNELRLALAELDQILKFSREEVNRHFTVGGARHFQLYGSALAMRAMVLRKTKRYDRAQHDLDRLVGLYPNHSQSYKYRGELWTATGDTAKAVSDFTRAIELNPSDTTNFRLRAYVLRGLNQHAAALEDLNLAIEIAPANGRNYLERAHLYNRLRNGDLALADYERAFALDGELLKVHLSSLMELGYYSGPRLSFVNDKIRNGLIACIVDPRC